MMTIANTRPIKISPEEASTGCSMMSAPPASAASAERDREGHRLDPHGIYSDEAERLGVLRNRRDGAAHERQSHKQIERAEGGEREGGGNQHAQRQVYRSERDDAVGIGRLDIFLIGAPDQQQPVSTRNISPKKKAMPWIASSPLRSKAA